MSKDSNSIVALSVSISARISPSSTLSPTFFSQVATVPSVIVSLKRGIVITFTLAGSWELEAGSFSSFTTTFSSWVLVFELLESNEVISSPSFPIIANKESTGAVSPARMPIYKRVPSLKDSNSIVALSVSISARMSPSLTLSPTFFNQVATVPSVIVSLKRGIVIIVAIIDYSL